MRPCHRRITLNVFTPKEGDQDKLVTLEVFPEITAATLREFIHTETNIEPNAQHIYHNGRLISDDTKTMEELGIADGEMLAVHVREARSAASAAPVPRARPQQQTQAPQGQGLRQMQDPETTRLQILGNPAMRQHLESQSPELAAVVDDPVTFAATIQNGRDREQRERIERQREIARLNEDHFNVDSQRRIEEIIRQERVMENLQSAMEHNPEGEHAQLQTVPCVYRS